MQEDEDKVKSILFSLNDWAREPRSANRIKVYHVEELYHALTQELVSTRLTRTLAKDKLAQDPYVYSSGNACDYHEQIDRAVHCSLYVAKKWAFIMCDHCCSFFGIDLIPGTHVPEDAEVSPRRPVKKPEMVIRESFYEVAPVDDEFDLDGVRRTRSYAAGIAPAGAAVENLEIKFQPVTKQLFSEFRGQVSEP